MCTDPNGILNYTNNNRLTKVGVIDPGPAWTLFREEVTEHAVAVWMQRAMPKLNRHEHYVYACLKERPIECNSEDSTRDDYKSDLEGVERVWNVCRTLAPAEQAR